MGNIKDLLELLREKCSECEGERGARGEESGMWYRCHVCDGTGFRPIDRLLMVTNLEALWKVNVTDNERLLENLRTREQDHLKEIGELRAELVNKTRFKDGA